MIRGKHLLQSAAGALLAAALLIPAAPAWAGAACSGVYATTVLQQVPLPMKIAPAQAPENPKLAERFMDGLRSAGGQIDPGSPLRLNLIFTTATPASGPMQGQVYNNFSWADQNGAFLDTSASVVRITAQVMDSSSYAYVWIATAQCTVTTRDSGAVAAELGALIGRTLGRSESNGTF
jgi:hypothetical protein